MKGIQEMQQTGTGDKEGMIRKQWQCKWKNWNKNCSHATLSSTNVQPWNMNMRTLSTAFSFILSPKTVNAQINIQCLVPSLFQDLTVLCSSSLTKFRHFLSPMFHSFWSPLMCCRKSTVIHNCKTTHTT
jgi:hypothetical protein